MTTATATDTSRLDRLLAAIDAALPTAGGYARKLAEIRDGLARRGRECRMTRDEFLAAYPDAGRRPHQPRWQDIVTECNDYASLDWSVARFRPLADAWRAP